MDEQGANTGGTGTPSVRRPDVTGWRGLSRRRAIAVVLTAALGFGGAAAIDQFALAAPDLTPVADLGPAGDGLTRLVVTPATGGVSDADLAALQATAGVVSVQRVFDGSALVATAGLVPADLAGVVPGADVQPSLTGTFSGGTVSDPYWAGYGYHLANTGTNAYSQTAVAGADIDAPTGWQAGTGRGMVVAITDSGMDTSHPDLQGALWTNPNCATDADGDGVVGDCHGWNFYSASADVVNAGGNTHGTGVAGIAAARAGNGQGLAGVAPDVQVMPLVVGYGSTVDVTAAAAAIHYAVDHGANVINASWGGPGTSSALTAAIDYAGAHGVLVVAAAGNDGADLEARPTYPASSTSPAVLTVGSSTAGDTVSSFSNYGRTSVDLFAPGSWIVSPAPGGGYSLMSGTSMAAPVTAAAVALYRAHYPTATMAQLRQQLLDDTQKVAAFAGRSVTGGRLSLTALGNTATEVRYGFTSMVAQPGPVTPQVVATGALPAGSYSVRFGLGEEYEGSVYAVSGQSLTLNGVPATTDDAGEAVFDLGTRAAAAPLVLSPTTVLPSARYVLTVQLTSAGAPVGLRFAAPLLVGQPAAGSTPAPAATTTPAAPTTPAAAPSTSRPATTTAPSVPTVGASAAPTVPRGSTTAGPTSTPARSTSAPSAPSAPATTAPATSAPAPATSAPVRSTTPAGTTSAPPASTKPAATPTGTATSAPSSGVRVTTPPPAGSATPTPSGGSAPSSSAPGTAPAPGGSISYPAVGDFGLTSISPSRVSAVGGTRVTITGTAIPANAVVRIGASTQAVVNTVSTTQLVFTAPALVAGVYDVTVSVPGGARSSVLTGGLTYLAAAGAPTTSAAAPSTSSAPSSSATSTPAAPTWRTGPHGERLVRSDTFRSLAPAIWKVNCSSACSGIAV